MSASRLLGRLQAMPDLPAEQVVARDLQHLLNAQKGVSAAHPHFGLGDYDAWLGQELWQALSQEMTAAVGDFLPALADVQIELLHRTTRDFFVFAIDATFESRRVRWLAVFDPRQRRFTCQLANKGGAWPKA